MLNKALNIGRQTGRKTKDQTGREDTITISTKVHSTRTRYNKRKHMRIQGASNGAVGHLLKKKVSGSTVASLLQPLEGKPAIETVSILSHRKLLKKQLSNESLRSVLRIVGGVALNDTFKLPIARTRSWRPQQSDHAPNILTTTNRGNTHAAGRRVLEPREFQECYASTHRREEKRRDSIEHRAPPRAASDAPAPPPPQRLPNPAGTLTHDSSG